MDFFDKIRVTLSSPLKGHSSEGKDLKTWTLPTQVLKGENVRLLLYRDCDRRGKKCLFDSAHVVREPETGKFLYIPVTNMGQVKDLSEWIFGCVPLSSSSTKRFHRWKGNLIWSKTFQAPYKSTKTGSSKNPDRNSSSCLSSTGDLSSSGYVSSSGVDDSSFDQSTDSSRNWSMPIVKSNDHSADAVKMSHSLPSRLELQPSKMILGVAVVIGTGDDDVIDSSEEIQTVISDRRKLRSYLSSISEVIETTTDWFATIALRSYYNPSCFVSNLHCFAEGLQQLVVYHVTCPLVSTQALTMVPKVPLNHLSNFLTVYLSHDTSWLNVSKHCSKPCKVVILASPKKMQDVKNVFMFLRLFNQCGCNKSQVHEISIQDKDPMHSLSALENEKSFSRSPRSMSDYASFKSWSSSPRPPPLEQLEESPTNDEVGESADIVTSTGGLIESDQDSLRMQRESTKDSGISSALSSTLSMRRTQSSKKFMTLLAPGGESFDEFDGFPGDSHSGVNFHLGEEPDMEQTFSMLELGEPNIDRLKQTPRPKFGSFESNTSSINYKLSPAVSISASESGSLDMPCFEISSRDSSESSTTPESSPIIVPLDMKEITSQRTNRPVQFCSYCDNVSVTEKFNPLAQLQWIRNSNFDAKNSLFTAGPNSSSDTVSDVFFSNMDTASGEIFQISREDWIFFNIDKNTVKYYSGVKNQEIVWTGAPSSLVSNLIDHVQVLTHNSKESEVEQFVGMQLDLIRKLGYDYGKNLMELTQFDVNSMPYAGEDDLPLLFAVAKTRYPELKERFFV